MAGAIVKVLMICVTILLSTLIINYSAYPGFSAGSLASSALARCPVERVTSTLTHPKALL